MSESEADAVVILSSELIADVMQVYFNKVMFKKPVSIVDLKPTETGYMFSLAFALSVPDVPVKSVSNGVPTHVVLTDTRDVKGRFTKQNSQIEG